MNFEVAAGLVVVCTFLLGWKLSFVFSKRKIQKVRDLKYGELKKIYDLTNSKMKTSVTELTELVDWVNTELYKELMVDVMANPSLTLLKERGGIPDVEYTEAFEGVVVDFQKSVSVRLQIAIDNINKKLVDDIKGLMNV